MGYYEVQVRVNTTGSAAAAIGEGQSPIIRGEVVAVHVNYSTSAPATTTVEVDEVEGPARRMLDKAASNTDVTHYPRVQGQDITGAPVAGVYERIVLHGRKVKVSVAASNQLEDAVVVTLLIKEDK